MILFLLMMIVDCREYFLQSVHTLYYLKNCKNSHNICTYPEKNDSQWVLEKKDDIFYIQIRDRCLDIDDYDNTIYLNKCNNVSSQDWILRKFDDFVFKILNVEERCFLSTDIHGNVFCMLVTINSNNKWFIF